jgi:hypothetical protein
MEYIPQNLKILIGIFQPILAVFLTKIEPGFSKGVAITVKSGISNTEKGNTFILRLGVAVR